MPSRHFGPPPPCGVLPLFFCEKQRESWLCVVVFEWGEFGLRVGGFVKSVLNWWIFFENS